ncbi:MAG: Os1348 family NHLP clan protein [Thermoguttaceae bacterium]|jgi:acyl carrier protein
MSQAIPQGIEVLVKKASVDAAFRALLLERPEEAVGQIGLDLGPAEAMMLRSVPREQLAAVIARTSVPEEHRRAFLGQAAAAMLGALGMMGCTVAAAQKVPIAPGGVAPDRPISKQPADNAAPPTPKEIQERVAKVLVAQLKVAKDDVTPEKLLAKDLGATGTKAIGLRTALAKEFKIKITAESFKKVRTVGDAADYVGKALQPPAKTKPTQPQPSATAGVRLD